MLTDFKAFIARGNVIDLAVAVIIGAAFATITTSITEDLIMPVVAFGHENLCSIRPDWTFWQWAATVYRLLGWILVSIALLTFSGILKKEV